MFFLLRRKNTYICSPSHFLCSISFVCFLLCQILHPLIHMKPLMCFLFCLFPPLTWFIFLLSGHSFVTLSEFSVCCAATFSSFLIYSLLFGISSPSYCLQSVTVALLSCRIQEQRDSFWEPHPAMLPLQSNLIFSLLQDLHLQQPLEIRKPVLSRRPKDSCWSWKQF